MKRDNFENNGDENDQQDDISPSSLIPQHCRPDPMKSELGQTLTANRSRMRSRSGSLANLDCSPDLKGKRPASTLSSPNSPTEVEIKKNKVTNSPQQ